MANRADKSLQCAGDPYLFMGLQLAEIEDKLGFEDMAVDYVDVPSVAVKPVGALGIVVHDPIAVIGATVEIDKKTVRAEIDLDAI